MAVFGRLAALTMREADAVVVREVFGRLDAQAALPGMRETVTTWRPDVVLRDPAEQASFALAEEHGLPHVQVGFGLDRLSDVLMPLLAEPLRELGCETAGLLTAPRWTLVPPSFDLPTAVAQGPPRRFREVPDADGGDRPCRDGGAIARTRSCT